jgi:methylase of polypeptide subunit release factors
MGEDQQYTWKGPGGPFSVTVADGVFAPSSTSRVLGEAMEVRPGDTVLDTGCGCGVLSFAAARLGAGRVIGSDLSPEAVKCATRNAKGLGLDDVTEFRTGPLFEPVRDVRADVIIADVSGIPDAVAKVTGWFPDGHGGGPTGAELPVEMLTEIGDHLTPSGRVYLPTASIQDEDAVLAAARRVFRDAMRPVASRTFPLPDAVTKAQDVARLVSDRVIHLTHRGSRMFWKLTIWCCGSASFAG